MDNSATILIIEDEAPIRKLLEITLQSSGYRIIMAATARDGKVLAATRQPDLVLLDLGLPDQDGQELLQDIREWYLKPVIILSARSAEEQIVLALDHGANDYLVKPFRTGELMARIRSALRQSNTDSEQVIEKNYGNLSINLASRTVKKGGEPVKLTSTEYALLTLFVKHEGKALTHQFILREVWGPGYVDRTEYPRVFVGQLRKKIEEKANDPVLIRTESGIGYRFGGG